MNTNNFIRVSNAIFSPEFLQANRGKKLIFYPESQVGFGNRPTVAPEDQDGEFIPCDYNWETTDTSESILKEGEIVKIGRDCDYVLLKAAGVVAYFGQSLGGYLVINLTNKVMATLEVLEMGTDKVLSERLVGLYDTEGEAQQAAYKAQQDGETCCIHMPGAHNAQEEEDLSTREMAEMEAEWEEANRGNF
jgi:hypothetical protein